MNLHLKIHVKGKKSEEFDLDVPNQPFHPERPDFNYAFEQAMLRRLRSEGITEPLELVPLHVVFTREA